MPRRGSQPVRKIKPDPIYASVLLAKLINRAMYDGKKAVVQTQVYKALGIVSQKTGAPPIKIFEGALDNVKPTMEVRPRRIGGAAYQVPAPVRGPRRESLGIKWLLIGARSRPNSQYHTFAEKLAAEIIDASKGEGLAVKKRQEVERVAEANRAFAHFKW